MITYETFMVNIEIKTAMTSLVVRLCSYLDNNKLIKMILHTNEKEMLLSFSLIHYGPIHNHLDFAYL